MARKPKQKHAIVEAAILSKDAMRRAVTARNGKVVAIEQILTTRPLRPASTTPPPRQMPPQLARRVFISYARRDRAIAKALARHLEARGIDVWWDFRLFPGDKFRDRILAELKAAAAVIVIWSDAAVVSDFVLDEASRGKTMGKLVSTLAPGFPATDLPLGFGQSHAVAVTDRAGIIDALAEYGIVSCPPRQSGSVQSPLA